jgi:hypothetical protein
MTYERPECVALGEAGLLVQGNKSGGTESGMALERIVGGNELDD